jgi:opacity protein-like surface antigen
MKKILAITFLILAFARVWAQDTVQPTAAPEEPTIDYTERTFWGPRIANLQSIETNKAGYLGFRVGHRAGRLSTGANNFFGLDEATFRMNFDLGITDWLMIGVGRSTIQKYYDGYIKGRILRQSTGKRNMPLSITGFAGMGINSLKWDSDYPQKYFTSRLAYTFQLIIARKFTNWFSAELVPTLVHRNMVPLAKDKNDVYAVGAGLQFKITPRFGINLEYNYLLPNQIYSQIGGQTVQNSGSIGLDIYTGKHVFQIFATNSTGMTEKQFITETTESWLKKGIRIGFNIERTFKLWEKD